LLGEVHQACIRYGSVAVARMVAPMLRRRRLYQGDHLTGGLTERVFYGRSRDRASAGKVQRIRQLDAAG